MPPKPHHRDSGFYKGTQSETIIEGGKWNKMGEKTFIYCPFNLGKFRNGPPVSLDWKEFLDVCLDLGVCHRCSPSSVLSKFSFQASFSFSSSSSSSFHPLTWRKRKTNTLWATGGGRGPSIQDSFCSVMILKTYIISLGIASVNIAGET